MANNERGERYILRSFAPTNYQHKKVKSNLFNLSNIGLNWDRALIKSSLAMGTTESNKDEVDSFTNVASQDFYDSIFAKTQDITRINNDYIAFFDRDYSLRRRYLRDFSMNGEINKVLTMIADDSIVPDSDNFFCHLNMKALKAKMKATKESEAVLDGLTESFNRVYQMYGWNESNDAWSYMKKFLTDGFLAFEILFDYDTTDTEQIKAKDIIGFKELDATTLQPDIVKDEVTGQDIKVWYQYKDDPEKQRIIPDSNLIYISWQKGNFEGRISYLEGLTRTFNMLRQMENSRVIWNIQNAQKRIKIVVPIGTSTPERARARLEELKAYYSEDIQIDDLSGTVTIDGQPKFSYNDTYIIPSKEGVQTEISELGVEGYDLGSTEQLEYWWRRFIMETNVPPNRFMLNVSNPPQNNMLSDANITREEYAYNRFIQRIQSIFKEIIIKPVWIQFCLRFPLFANSQLLHSLITIEYNAENLFQKMREATIAQTQANAIMSLQNLKGYDGKPVFSGKFLATKYLNFSEADWKQNEDYKLQEAKQAIDMQVDAKQGQETAAPGTGGLGMDMGIGDMGMAGGDMGMASEPSMNMSDGMDMSGGDMSMTPDMSGTPDMGGDMAM